MALSVQEQLLVEQRVTNEGKSVGLAYLFWLFLGLFSAHRFYLGRPKTAILQIVLNFLVIGLVWTLLDAFVIPAMVRQDQERLRERYGRMAIGMRPEH